MLQEDKMRRKHTAIAQAHFNREPGQHCCCTHQPSFAEHGTTSQCCKRNSAEATLASVRIACRTKRHCLA